MKHNYIVFVLLGLLLLSCTENKNKIKDYGKTLYSPVYSSSYEITGEEDSENTKITVYNPWQGAKNITSQLFIVRDSVIPKNTGEQILLGNAKRIICMSSTHIAMLDALDATDKIVGVSGKQYISNPKLLAKSNLIPDVGYEGNIDYETIIAAKPDLILLFSVNGISSLEPRLKELRIPFLYVGDYLEEDPLGKAEWIIPLSEVLGEREKGIKEFENIEAKYLSLKEKVKNEVNNRPKVMVNAPFLDSWFMPSSESYVATMIEDAGAEYIYKKNTGNSSLPIDMEEALKLVSESDYWINMGTVKSSEELKNSFPKFLKAKCVSNGNIFNNNLRSSLGGGNDCYESGVVNPDLILRDMIKIFHPELVDEEFVYYHQLK